MGSNGVSLGRLLQFMVPMRDFKIVEAANERFARFKSWFKFVTLDATPHPDPREREELSLV